MRRRATLIGAGLMVAGSMFFAAPASASASIPVCVGTAATVVVCVDTSGRILYSDCIYVGAPPCTYVEVYGPTVTCGGTIGTRICSAIQQH